MSDFVLDASVTLAAHLPATPAQRAYSAAVLRLIRAGAVPAVPALWAMEIGAVLIKAKRKRLITQPRMDAAVKEIDMMSYDEHHMPFTVPGMVRIAKDYMLQGYDAVYFDLAKRLGIPLASLDHGHRTACRAHNVKLLTF